MHCQQGRRTLNQAQQSSHVAALVQVLLLVLRVLVLLQWLLLQLPPLAAGACVGVLSSSWVAPP